jgi:hypothetical protein
MIQRICLQLKQIQNCEFELSMVYYLRGRHGGSRTRILELSRQLGYPLPYVAR